MELAILALWNFIWNSCIASCVKRISLWTHHASRGHLGKWAVATVALLLLSTRPWISFASGGVSNANRFTAPSSIATDRPDDNADRYTARSFSCPAGGVLYVTPSGAGTQDGTSWANAMTLQDALTVADACDIWAAGGVYTPGASASDTFSIGSNISVYGGYAGTGTTRDTDLYKTVLSGDIDNDDTNKVDGVTTTHSDIVGTNSLQVVTLGNVTSTTMLDGVVVTGGDGGTIHEGGGISCVATSGNTCSPTLSNLQIVGNRAKHGGGLLVGGSGGTASPIIENTTFSNNKASESGGGVYMYGLSSGTSSPTFTNVDFLDNEANQGGGVRIVAHSSGTANPTFTGGSFVGNQATNGQAGAIYLYITTSGQAAPTFTDINIADNSATTFGGALGVFVNTVNASNTASASPTFRQVQMVGNTAPRGGAIYHTVYGSHPDNSNSDLTLVNSTIANNTATLYGGGVYNFAKGGGEVIANNTIIANNEAQGTTEGQNILNHTDGVMTLNDSLLPSNTITDVHVHSGAVVNYGTGVVFGDPRFVDVDGADNVLGNADDDLQLRLSSPAVNGGDNSYITGVTTDLNGNTRIQDTTVDMGAYETATPLTCPGGGILYVNGSNTGSQDGASWATAFVHLEDALTVSGTCDIWVAQGVYTPGTTVTDTFSIGSNISVYGGYAGTGTTRDTDLYKTVLSGDIGNDDTNKVDGVTTTHSDIVGTNSSRVVYMTGSNNGLYSGIIVTGGDGGTATDGGGIYCDGCTSTLEADIIGNRARYGAGLLIIGDGDTASPTIRNSTISNNKASGTGGGLYMYGSSNGTSSPTFTDVDFLDNEANQGGGVRISALSSGTANPTFTGGSFVGNQATNGQAGAIYLYISSSGQAAPTFTDINIADNSSTTYGGALAVYVNTVNASNTASASPTFEQVQMAGNSSTRGGAIYHTTYGSHPDSSDSDLTFVNSTIANNTSILYGGGIYNAAGGNGGIVLNNTIIADNQAGPGTGGGQQIVNVTNGNVQFNYSLVPSNTRHDVQNDESGLIDYGTGTLFGDPRFVDVDGADNVAGNADDDLQLRLSSPAVNGGDNAQITGVTTDLNGNTRIQDTTVDMGAYETATPLTCPGGGILYVNGSNTGTQDGTSWATAFVHLEDALTVSDTCDIWVAQGVYTPGTTVTDTFSIGSNISVYGGYLGTGTTRDTDLYKTVLSGDIDNDDTNKVDGVTTTHSDIVGTNSSRVVYMTGSNNGLYSGIIVTGGDGGTTSDGSGIYCDGCTSTLEADIIGNRARSGAGLLIIGDGDTASPTIRNSTISNNKASSTGGGLFMYGSSNGTSSPTFTNVDFLDNEANQGGGIRITAHSSGTANPTFTGGSFVGNQATNGQAGAIYLYISSSGQAAPTFTDINIADNSSTTYGGALAVYVQTVNASNTASASPTFEQVQMAGNISTRGGAIYHTTYGSHPDSSDSDLTFVNSTIANNTSILYGGGIYNTAGGNGGIVLNNTIIADNKAGPGTGGGQQIVNITNGNVQFNYSLVPSNTRHDVQNDESGLIDYGTGTLFGDPRFVDVDGADNVAGNADDDLQLRLSSPAVNGGDNAQITGVTTDLNGNTRIQDTTVDMGVYETTPLTCPGGGILYVNGSNTGTQDGTSWATAFVHLEDALTVNGTCDIRVAGGTYTPGIAVTDTFSIDSNISVYGGYAGSGGSPDTRDGTIHPTVLSGDIDNNDTNKDSHGMTPSAGDIVGTNSLRVVHITGTNNRLDGVVVTGGDAKTASGGGGGILCNGSGSTCNPTFEGLWVQGNRAETGGGGLYIEGLNGTASPQISSSTFINNSADVGGAINVEATGGTTHFFLINSTFLNNTASYAGGGLYINVGAAGQSNPTISDTLFENNEATTHIGGGVAMHVSGGGDAAPTLTNVQFVGNTAAVAGGAFSAEVDVQNAGDPSTNAATFRQLLFNGNTANEAGALLFQTYGSQAASSPSVMTVVNSTFVNNHADLNGGAVVNGAGGSGHFYAYNTIFANNTAGSRGNQIFSQFDGAATLAHSLVPSKGISDFDAATGTIDTSAASVLVGDPLFVDADGADDVAGNSDDDLQIRLTSPAVESGDSSRITGVTTDLAGNTRVQGTAVDMGVYETAAPLTCPGGGILYVNGSNTGTQDGTSWATAFTNLEDALTVSGACDIWVAQGVYTPGTNSIDRFNIGTGINVYGGYLGTGTTRDTDLYKTVLSGDIDNDDTNKVNGITTTYSDIVGTNTQNVVWIEGTNNRLDGVTVTGGDSPLNGGGIVCDGDGGGECSPTLYDLHIVGNRAQTNVGGGIFFAGWQGTVSPHVEQVIVENNWAQRGGGIYVEATVNTSAPTFISTTIRNNQAATYAGGMYVDSGYSGQTNLTITDSLFEGNSTTIRGGGLDLVAYEGGTLLPTLTNVQFVGNTATDGGGLASSAGGDDAGTPATLSPTLRQVLFNGNTTTNQGGAIYHQPYGAAANSMLGTFTLVNATIVNNSSVWGGGLNVGAVSSGHFYIYNSILTNNTATSGGNQILNRTGGNMTLANSLLSSPSSADVENNGNAITYGSGMRYGSAHFIDIDGADNTVGNADDNLRALAGSQTIDNGDNTHISGVTSDLDSNTRTQGRAVDMGAYEATPLTCPGGGVLYVTPAGAGTQDGASWANAMTLQAALQVTDACDIWAAQGVYTPGSSPYDTFSILSDIKVYGGYLGTGTTRDTATYKTVLSGDIDNNDTNKDSDGVTTHPDNIVGTNSENVVKITGTNNRLDGVVVTGGDSSILPGGGVYCLGTGALACSPTISSVWFQGNRTTGAGGGMMANGAGGTVAPQIDNSTFISNTANYGGGLFMQSYGGGTVNSTVDSTDFRYNTAGVSGGGLQLQSGATGTVTAAISNVTFERNKTTTSHGGGMFAFAHDGGVLTPALTNVQFISNTAVGAGGALASEASVEDAGNLSTVSPTLKQVLFNGNSAPEAGALFHQTVGAHANSSPSIMTLVNATVVNNHATLRGGALLSGAGGSGHLYIYNTIFANNTTDGSGHQIHSQLDGAATLANSLVPSKTTDDFSINSGTIDTSAASVLVGEPRFVDVDGADNVAGNADDDFQLRLSSPAVESGDSSQITGVTTDLAGNTRVQGTVVDMGVYETVAPLTCPGGGILYVNGSNTGTQDGASWATAFTNLEDALTVNGTCEIRVAGGLYTPGSSPSDTFSIGSNISVYGGYAGSGASPDVRDGTVHPTVLSGDIDNNDTNKDSHGMTPSASDIVGTNSDHIVTMTGTGNRLDGVVISGGDSTGAAANSGAALYCDGASGKTCNPALVGLWVQGNKTDSGNVFIDAYAGTASPTIEDSTFISNSATYGAAIWVRSHTSGLSQPTLTNNTFSNNIATNTGGALYLHAETNSQLDLTLSNLTVENNSAPHGAGMFVTNNSNSTVNLNLQDSTFTANVAGDHGGGLRIDTGGGAQSTSNLTDVTFTNNAANGGHGGGYFTFAAGSSSRITSTLTSVQFIGNTAGGGGGGFGSETLNDDAVNPASNVSNLRQVLFNGNSAQDGGAIFHHPYGAQASAAPSLMTIANGTFVNNSSVANGGAIINFSGGAGGMNIHNSIFANNQAGGSGHQMASRPTGDTNNNGNATLTHSLVPSKSSADFYVETGAIDTSAVSVLTGDPLFVDVDGADNVAGNADDDLHLSSLSPAVNGGDNTQISGISSDLDGNTRILYGTVDMGVYETELPEIDVQGNGVSIVSGDVTPSTTDHTAFGSINVGDRITRTFTISNSGSADLTLTNTPAISITGTHTSDFAVTTSPVTLINGNNTTTFKVTFTPSAVGIRTATVSIANSDRDETLYTFAIEGIGLNVAPVAVDNVLSTNEDTAVTVNVISDDSDVNGDVLSISNVGTPSSGTATINGTTDIVYTPTLNFFGTDSFTYEVSDGTLTDSGRVTVTVTAVADPVTAVADAEITFMATAVTLPAPGVLANDIEVDGTPLNPTITVQPQNGSATLSVDGSLTYTPEADFVGTDTFTYEIGNGTFNDSAEISILVLHDDAQVDVPLVTGWNLVGYPLANSQLVTEALISITGQYTTVLGYDASDSADPWRQYDPTLVPPFAGLLNDLSHLEQGEAYWIQAKSAVTLSFSGGQRTVFVDELNRAGHLDAPPMLVYGYVDLSDGALIEAWAGDQLCGSTVGVDTSDGAIYGVHVSADCGSQITLTVADRTVATLDWDNNVAVQHDIMSPTAVTLYSTTTSSTDHIDLVLLLSAVTTVLIAVVIFRNQLY